MSAHSSFSDALSRFGDAIASFFIHDSLITMLRHAALLTISIVIGIFSYAVFYFAAQNGLSDLQDSAKTPLAQLWLDIAKANYGLNTPGLVSAIAVLDHIDGLISAFDNLIEHYIIGAPLLPFSFCRCSLKEEDRIDSNIAFRQTLTSFLEGTSAILKKRRNEYGRDQLDFERYNKLSAKRAIAFYWHHQPQGKKIERYVGTEYNG